MTLRSEMRWPPAVVVRGAWYGCDTGCDGFEVATDDADEARIDFVFGDVETEADARRLLRIPTEVAVRFVPGRLDP